nr:MAG TPA: RNaseP [Caudoviricetes sp.]
MKTYKRTPKRQSVCGSCERIFIAGSRGTGRRNSAFLFTIFSED